MAMESKPRKKLMDVLAGSDSEGDSSSEEQSDGEPTGPGAPAAKKVKQELTLEQLEEAGYHSGPSVLHIRAPKEEVQQDLRWSDGRAQKALEDEEETVEERIATHAAATTAAEESARFAVRAVAHAEEMRQQARAEKEQRAQEKRLSFNQKEKRKRDAGQASRGKNYVEEEKRLARNLGVYSGFD